MSFVYRAVMFVGSWVCHQLPERSPHVIGVQFPLCWRCSGILVGSVALLCWLIVKKRLPPLVLSVTLGLLLPLDVLYSVVTGGDGDNARRLATGVLWGLFGVATALHFMRLVRERLATRRLATRSLATRC